MIGTVTSFNSATGYGSIKTEAGADVFFASSALAASGGERSLNQGQRVQFDIVQESGRDFATKVVLL
jgi:CspA family cold shock protein